MNPFQKLRNAIFPPKAPPAPARPAHVPNWLQVDGELVDLNALSPEQLAALEVLLTQRRQQREAEFAQYLHGLAAERARLLAGADFRLWLMTLQMMFGEAIGQRVAVQDIVPGMQLQHLIISFGQPDHVAATPTGVAFGYGDRATGSYFEVQGDTITHAAIVSVPPLPLALDAGA